MEPGRFLRKRYRVRVAEKSEGDHWQGGPAYHDGARCPSCEIPLLLLWDINCKDARFPRRKFGTIRRLPLYFCGGCFGDLGYQLVGDARIRVVTEAGRKPPSFPYKPYPAEFPRRPLALDDAVPDQIRRLVGRIYSGESSSDTPKQSRDRRRILSAFFGHRVVSPMCTVHHQLGGKPLSYQWAVEVFECPNPDCTGKAKLGMNAKSPAMKFLAGVLNDPWKGLPLGQPANEKTKEGWDYFVSVQFHVCDRCWTIYACNRYD